jgi:antitoxin (DNA-binding transcriptional repressor) of toxin-antitoxin stability system
MSITQVSKSEFKAKALEYFRQVKTSGLSVIVTDHGTPEIEVRPYHHPQHKPLDILRGSVIRYLNPTDPIGDDDWEAAE